MSANKNTAVKSLSMDVLSQVTGGTLQLDWDGKGFPIRRRGQTHNYQPHTMPRSGLIFTELEPNG